jgi:hypothetical protein
VGAGFIGKTGEDAFETHAIFTGCVTIIGAIQWARGTIGGRSIRICRGGKIG